MKMLRKMFLFFVISFLIQLSANAGTPVWTMTPVVGFLPTVTVNSGSTATIKYTVTNMSTKTHILQMKPIKGIIASGCTSPLVGKLSCTLELTVDGSVLQGDVSGGPVLCEVGNQLLCYQPALADSLRIQRLPVPPVQYTITPLHGSNGSISPSVDQIVNAGSTVVFTAIPQLGYGTRRWTVDGSIVQNGGDTFQLNTINANHTVRVTFGLASLQLRELALSINCQPLSTCPSLTNAALTGRPRQMLVTNIGIGSAYNLVPSSSGLPSGTTITGTTCGTILNPGDTCSVEITPGSIASSDVSNNSCTTGTEPVPGIITVNADGGISAQGNVYVLGYGCLYQGGYLYAVNDTSSTGGLRGQVVSTGDQSNGIVWAADGTNDPDFTVILGIDNTSTSSNLSPSSPPYPAYPAGTPAPSACNGLTDGRCNSDNILGFYLANNRSGSPPPTPNSWYATGLCNDYAYSNEWYYLPAICEMTNNGPLSCPANVQSMTMTLPFLIGNACSNPLGTQCLDGIYYSSTEDSGNPENIWATDFKTSGSIDTSETTIVIRYSYSRVRCVHNLADY